jgi:ribosomal protein S18 acetylase RimI-like enzyme
LTAPGDFDRAMEFVLRADMAGTRVEPFRWGTVVSMPEFPLRLDSNYLRVERAPADATAAVLAAEADRIQGALGLGQRCLLVPDAVRGEALAPGFEALGWKVHRGVVMALRRPPEVAVDAGLPALVEGGSLRAVREAAILSAPWATAEIARQILDARALVPVETLHLAVRAEGVPASWAEVYLGDRIAQIEAVATVERFRRRGFASAVVVRCCAEARRRGADLVFLCADALGRPRDLYRRLGFDALGGFVKFLRE